MIIKLYKYLIKRRFLEETILEHKPVWKNNKRYPSDVTIISQHNKECILTIHHSEDKDIYVCYNKHPIGTQYFIEIAKKWGIDYGDLFYHNSKGIEFELLEKYLSVDV